MNSSLQGRIHHKSNDDELTAVKHALHLACGDICREEEKNEEKNSGGRKKHAKISNEGIAALTELTFHYAKNCMASDLILFSQHANRKTVTVADVKLVAARKNPRGLLASLESFCENQSLNVKEKKSNQARGGLKKRSRKDAFIDSSDDDDDDDDGKASDDDGLGLDLGESYDASNARINFNIQVDESSSSSSSSENNSKSSSEDESIPMESAAKRTEGKCSKRQRLLIKSLSSSDDDEGGSTVTENENRRERGVQNVNATIEILDDDDEEE